MNRRDLLKRLGMLGLVAGVVDWPRVFALDGTMIPRGPAPITYPQFGFGSLNGYGTFGVEIEGDNSYLLFLTKSSGEKEVIRGWV